MDTKHIYEKTMLETYFNKIKCLRHGVDCDNYSYKHMPDISQIIDIGGENSRKFEYIMTECHDLIYEMINVVIEKLIIEYEIPVDYYDLRTDNVKAYYFGEDKYLIGYSSNNDRKRVLALKRTDKFENCLFVFKKYGFNNSVPEETLKGLMKEIKLKRYYYVSYVEEGAFTEVINHNDDKNDPTRGTGIISLKMFFQLFFGKEEYLLFKKYSIEFSKKVRDYLGISLVRTLKPNAMLNFKKLVLSELKGLDIALLGVNDSIEETQKEILDKHYFEEKNYELLLGNSDFAKSFLTAEWLYHSLSEAGNIDLTAVSMGYFKSIEQFLFHYISLHTNEKDNCSRTIFIGKGKNGVDDRGYVDLTDSIIDNRSKEIALGSVTGFFGYHDKRKNQYYKRNMDLLVDGISEITYEFIIDTLDGIKGVRNGYFHKDNLEEWDKVTEARNTALRVFYLFLGAYNISDNDKTLLGVIRVNDHDDYYKLCEYINRKAYEHLSHILELPVFYLREKSDPYEFAFPYQDDFIEYDNFGDSIYSGLYFKEFGERNRIIKMTRDNLPEEMWEGEFIINKNLPTVATNEGIKLSGPKKLIFSNGKFVAKDEFHNE